MNKLFLLLLIPLCIAFVSADKVILSVPYCYNVTIHSSRLFQGNYTPISFLGCTQYSDNSWYCNCIGIDGYNVTLVNDNTILYSDLRKYVFELSYTSYAFDYFNDTIYATDYGDSLGIEGDYPIGTGQNVIYRDVPVNVYLERQVNFTQNITKYVDRDIIINNTVYVEVSNTSELSNKSLMIAQLQDDSLSYHNQRNTMNVLMILSVFIIISLGIWIFDLKKNR